MGGARERGGMGRGVEFTSSRDGDRKEERGQCYARQQYIPVLNSVADGGRGGRGKEEQVGQVQEREGPHSLSACECVLRE